ncbi:hypothetical protein BGZ76_009407 [Entomortierella beljakovae]|nr:hypothetical protein BGZ76_009407 [Entomortierella beljakovae]
MLGYLLQKKTGFDQILIYFPQHSVESIRERIDQLNEESKIAKRPRFQRWTPDEDILLAKAVEEFGADWNKISETCFPPRSRAIVTSEAKEAEAKAEAEAEEGRNGKSHGTKVYRTPRSCQMRWRFLGNSTNPAEPSPGKYNTGAWSAEELDLLQELINPNATPEEPNDWKEISLVIGTRSPIQCHSQFKSVLHTKTKGKWTLDELNRLKEANELYGRDWQKVSAHVGTRAPGQVRQKWNQFSEDVIKRLKAKE